MFNLLPKDAKFYDELETLADRVVSAAKQFQGVVENFPRLGGELNSIEQDRLAARKIYSRIPPPSGPGVHHTPRP